MELALLVYGISALSNFVFFLVFICIFLVIMTLFALASYDCNYTDDKKELWTLTSKTVRKYLVATLILSLVITLIPSQKTMYVMVGAYAAQKVAQAPETKVISEKVLKIIEIELDAQVNEVKQITK